MANLTRTLDVTLPYEALNMTAREFFESIKGKVAVVAVALWIFGFLWGLCVINSTYSISRWFQRSF